MNFVTQTELRRIDLTKPEIATAPNSSRFMMGISDGTVSLWDVTTAKGVMAFNGHEKPLGAIMMSPDNKLAISQDHSGVIILWRLPN